MSKVCACVLFRTFARYQRSAAGSSRDSVRTEFYFPRPRAGNVEAPNDPQFLRSTTRLAE